ncbi:hypothetical protein BDR22DRAFT_822273 [Usnea florida]
MEPLGRLAKINQSTSLVLAVQKCDGCAKLPSCAGPDDACWDHLGLLLGPVRLHRLFGSDGILVPKFQSAKSRGGQISSIVRISNSVRELWQFCLSRRMIEVFVLLDDYSLWEGLPSFPIVAHAQKRRAFRDTDVRAYTKESGSAATLREDDGRDVKSITEAYVVVSARKDMRDCERGSRVIVAMKSDLAVTGRV